MRDSDRWKAKYAGLEVDQVRQVKQLASASHADHPCKLFPIHIALPGLVFNCPRAMSANLRSQRMIAIIGRDILQGCTLFYNGPIGQLTLSI